MLFFESGHGPPLLRYFEQLFLDVGVGHLSSALFAVARFGPIRNLARFQARRSRLRPLLREEFAPRSRLGNAAQP